MRVDTALWKSDSFGSLLRMRRKLKITNYSGFGGYMFFLGTCLLDGPPIRAHMRIAALSYLLSVFSDADESGTWVAATAREVVCVINSRRHQATQGLMSILLRVVRFPDLL